MTWSTFRHLITSHFNVEELRTLCFDLNIDYESLPGEGKEAKSRELVQFARRSNQVPALVAKLKEIRPNVPWHEVLENNLITVPPTLRDRPQNRWIIAGTILVILLTISTLLLSDQLPILYQSGSRETLDDLSDMVFIEPGEFIRGTNDGKADQGPARTIYLDEYWIDVYEVTNEAYQQFIIATNRSSPDHWAEGRYASGRDNHPVVGVTWYDADEYCRYVGKRLPTEAEWEKAARGTDGRVWPWGNTWIDGRANTFEAGINDTKPVGSYLEGNSPYGLADAAGNVWEWVNDWYSDSYYASAPSRNPTGPVASNLLTKVVKGGSWIEDQIMATPYFRLGIYPPHYPPSVPEELINPIAYIGFRCACDNCRN